MKHLRAALQGITIATIYVGILLWAHAVHAAFWALVTELTFMECFQSSLIVITGVLVLACCFAQYCTSGHR